MQLPPGVTRPALARASFAFYMREYFGLTVYPHIQRMIALLESPSKQCCIIMPPGFAKSTVVSQLYPSWYLGNHPDRSVLLISSTDKQAKLFLNANKETMDHHEGWKEVFPDVQPDPGRGWSSDGLFLRWKRDPNTGLELPDWRSRPATIKDPAMAAFGIGGPVIGRRADLIVVDDPYSQDVARSDVSREAFSAWFKQTLMSRLKPELHCKIIVCLTRWHPADIVQEMLELNRLESAESPASSPQ